MIVLTLAMLIVGTGPSVMNWFLDVVAGIAGMALITLFYHPNRFHRTTYCRERTCRQKVTMHARSNVHFDALQTSVKSRAVFREPGARKAASVSGGGGCYSWVLNATNLVIAADAARARATEAISVSPRPFHWSHRTEQHRCLTREHCCVSDVTDASRQYRSGPERRRRTGTCNVQVIVADHRFQVDADVANFYVFTSPPCCRAIAGAENKPHQRQWP